MRGRPQRCRKVVGGHAHAANCAASRVLHFKLTGIAFAASASSARKFGGATAAEWQREPALYRARPGRRASAGAPAHSKLELYKDLYMLVRDLAISLTACATASAATR